MEKEFIPYEIALALKDLGFDEICISRYCIITEWEKPTGTILLQQTDCTFLDKNVIKAPLYQQTFRWFREKYNVHFLPKKYDETKWWVEWGTWTSPVFETYEEAELECLKKLIEIIKNK